MAGLRGRGPTCATRGPQIKRMDNDKSLDDPAGLADGHRRRAFRLERDGRYEEAVLAYRSALGFNPRNLGAHVGLGLLLRTLGRDEEANQVFSAAIDLCLSGPTSETIPPSERPRNEP